MGSPFCSIAILNLIGQNIHYLYQNFIDLFSDLPMICHLYHIGRRLWCVCPDPDYHLPLMVRRPMAVARRPAAAVRRPVAMVRRPVAVARRPVAVARRHPVLDFPPILAQPRVRRGSSPGGFATCKLARSLFQYNYDIMCRIRNNIKPGTVIGIGNRQLNIL